MMLVSTKYCIILPIPFLMNTKNILCWNCRGAGNQRFARSIREMKRNYNPEIIALLETRVSGEIADNACRGTSMRSWFRTKADGFSGGIWILWDEERVSLKVVHAHYQFVHIQISRRDEEAWFLTIVYASPHAT